MILNHEDGGKVGPLTHCICILLFHYAKIPGMVVAFLKYNLCVFCWLGKFINIEIEEPDPFILSSRRPTLIKIYSKPKVNWFFSLLNQFVDLSLMMLKCLIDFLNLYSFW